MAVILLFKIQCHNFFAVLCNMSGENALNFWPKFGLFFHEHLTDILQTV